MVQNEAVESSGKHAGSHRAEPAATPAAEPSERSRSRLLALALAVTLSVVAWGYLVYAAIDFGSEARGGESRAWWFLGLASLGAVACLFVGLLLVARVMRMLGVSKGPEGPPPPPRPVGGKRAAR
jgi:RsiW-degrading membrane proteinase PrsW (M82 family)